MLKIALLGVDSGHFDVFAEILLKKGNTAACIHSIWGENRAEAMDKSTRLGLDLKLIKDEIGEALEGADAAMVIGRFAESHLAPAMVSLSKKIPTFIDKPVANNLSELKEMIEVSKEAQTAFDSFSIYRFSETVASIKKFIQGKNISGIYLTGPRYCKDLGNDPRFSDIYFYGIHSVEILLEIAGYDVERIHKIDNERSLHAMIEFKSGILATINFASDLEQEFYYINVITDKGIISHEIKYEEVLYAKTLNHLLQFFSSQKKYVENESNWASLEILDYMREGKSL